MIDYSKLQRAAEAVKAMDYPWEHTVRDGRLGKTSTEYARLAHPSNILDLIAENEALRTGCSELRGLFADAAEQCCKAERERDQFKAAYSEWMDKMAWARTWDSPSELGKHIADVVKGRFDALLAENEELRKDAERFRFIERDADSGMRRIYGDDWIAVIDAAGFQDMSKEPSNG